MIKIVLLLSLVSFTSFAENTNMVGQLVLTKEQKPYLIKSVLNNDQFIAIPLEINRSSRYRLKSINEYFAPISRAEEVTLDKSQIRGVHQKCTADKRYCKDQMIKEINGITICENIVRYCRNSEKKIYIDGIFSDGTIMLGGKLFPPETFVPRDRQVIESPPGVSP